MMDHVTRRPVDTSIPTASCPRMEGAGAALLPANVCKSLPQMVQAVTRTRLSPGCNTELRNEANRSGSPGPSNKAAV